MSQLLEKAVAVARRLPEAEQDAIAALILEEIEAEQKWEEALDHSPDTLTALAARAEEQARAGHCRAGGFDGV
jgi:hypothetical protein